MTRAITQPTVIGPAQTLFRGSGAYQGPRVWLCGRENLIATDNWETGTLGSWTAPDDGDGPATLAVEYDPLSLHARYVLRITDDSGVDAQSAEITAVAGSIFGHTFLVAFHIERMDANAVGRVELRQVFDTVVETATFSLSRDEGRGWFWWLVTTSDENWDGASVMDLRIYPRHPAASTGDIRIASPRLHRVFSELTDWPANPAPELSIVPRVTSEGGVGLGFGGAPPVQDGVTLDLDCDFPFIDVEHAKDVAALVGHPGYVLVQPEASSPVAALVTRPGERLSLPYAGGHMSGYTSSTRLVGVEPFFTAPDSPGWRETAAGPMNVSQKWMQGV